MPIIESGGTSPLVVFDIPYIDLTATAAPVGPRVVFDIPFIDLTASGAVQINGAATVDIPFIDLTAQGRIDAEPDIFASVSFDIPFIDLTANGALKVEGVVVFDIPFIDFDATSTNIALETSELNFIIDILPPASAGNYIEQWLPRLKVNGVEIPVINGQYSEDSDSAGAELQVNLARISDKSLLTETASIDFGFGRKISGVWDEATFTTLIASGIVRDTGHSIGWQDNQPTDAVQVTTEAALNNKFLRTPETDLVIYDSLRQTLNANEFEPLLDTAGNQYVTELMPIPNLTLYSLFQEVFVNRCGFTSYKTNLPDFPVNSVNCAIGRPFLDGIRGYFGMFDPVIFAVGNEVWIVDTTITQPAGFPAPRTAAISNYQTLSVSNNLTRLDGMIVQYVEDKRAYDYTTTRFETATEENGESGQPNFTSTFIQRSFRQYRRFSNPSLVLKEEIFLEVRTTTSPFQGTIGESRESYTFDSNGQLTFREKTEDALVPSIENPGTFDLRQVFGEREAISYAAHPFKPELRYAYRRDIRTDGLIAVDSDNQQLGVDFQLDYVTAYRRGNLTEGMTTRFGAVKTFSETIQPLRNGQVKIKTYEADHLARIVVKDGTEERSGEVGISSVAPTQNQVLVLDDDNAVRSTKRLDSLHAGELPLTQAVPLARRRLKVLKTRNRTIDARVIGYDSGLRKGTPITATGRDETIGTFLILGRNVQFGREGVFMNLTCKEI